MEMVTVNYKLSNSCLTFLPPRPAKNGLIDEKTKKVNVMFSCRNITEAEVASQFSVKVKSHHLHEAE